MFFIYVLLSMQTTFKLTIQREKGVVKIMNNTVDYFLERAKNFMPKWLGYRVTQAYLFFMLVIFPFYYTDGMFRLHLDKRDFLLSFAGIYAFALFPLALIALYDWGNDTHAPKKPDTIFPLILLSVLAISTVFTIITPRRAFFEVESRTISGLCFLCCIFIFFAVRQYAKVDQLLLWTWLAGSSGLYLFGILCACGINVLHIQDGLDPWQLPTYLTPLSNTNYNTCYVCLMLPPIMVLYMICKNRLSQILCGINLYLGFLFTFFIKTDSSFIALLLGFILLGYFALEKDSWAMHYVHIPGIYLGAKLTIRVLLHLYPEKIYPFHGLHVPLLDSKLLIREIICYLIFFIIWKWIGAFLREKLASARKILVIIAITLVCCCIACVIYINISTPALAPESFWNYLILNDSTCSGRGYIWSRTLSVIKEESIGRKLFGNGLNSFRALMLISGAVPAGDMFEDPHNEILQIITDMGLLGFIGYFGLLFTSLIKALRGWHKNKLHVITVLTLSVYMIQALANEYSIFTFPLLCIFLGLANSKLENL